MKIFLDTAHIEAIKKWSETGLIDGVTTNPTHLSAEGGDPLVVIKQILYMLPDKSISIEVTETEPDAVYRQAQAIAALGPNVAIKIPCDIKYLEIIKKLVQEKITINITLLFSVTQALIMCKLGVAYISPFIGRLEDTGGDGKALLEDLRSMVDHYGFKTQILAASIRSVQHVHDALAYGADVVTLPPELLEKMVHHPLTDAGIRKFAQDWKKLGTSKFP